MKRLICAYLTAIQAFVYAHSSYAVTEGVSAALVAGAVNAITGDHYVAEIDYQVQAAVPLTIPRVYMSSRGSHTFVGWQLFQHLYAGYMIDENEDPWVYRVELVEPNGTVLNFEKHKVRNKIKRIFFNPIDTSRTQGLTNTGRGKVSGQTNLKNIRVEMPTHEKDLTVYGSDGALRFYQKTKKIPETLLKDNFQFAANGWYRLEWERLPNQTKIFYGYDDRHRLSNIRTTNATGSKTYASANLHYHSNKDKNQNFDIHTSDCRVLNYQFGEHHGHHRIHLVNTPAFPGESMSHDQSIKDGGVSKGYLLTERRLPDHRKYQLSYYEPGKNHVGGTTIKLYEEDPRVYRVKTLSELVGTDATPHVTHTFFYDVDHQVTDVRDIHHILTRYNYSSQQRLNTITRYGHGDAVHATERFVWSEAGVFATQLLCHTFYESAGSPVLSKRFFYDDRGNVLEERVYGQVSGRSTSFSVGNDGFPSDNGAEFYSIRRSYSQDTLHLLLREEEPSGKVTVNSYVPDTSILSSQLICEGNQVKIRHFYDYTGDHILWREITDDGSSSDRNDLSGVRTRKIKTMTLIPTGQPYQDMPQIIEEKYWDDSQEVLLKKTVLTYTTGGLIEKQDIFDASDTYCYSLNFKYDSTGRLIEETNALNQTAKYSYDSVGNKIFAQDFSGKKEGRYSYDYSNRLTQIEETGSDGIKRITRHQYDGRHNRISTIDLFGQETRYVPDPFGHIVEVHMPPIPNPQGSLISPITYHNYDTLGREIMTKEANGDVTKRRYNIRNQATFIEHPDHTTEWFVYNLDGTLNSHTNQKSAMTTYTYDFLGRMTSKTDPLGQTTTYDYDAFNLISMTDAEGNVTQYEYDGAGRKIAEQLNQERTEHSYDALGRLHIVKQGDLLTITEYNYLGQMIEERKESSSGTLLSQTKYAYDEAGNPSIITRSIDGREAQETFLYDAFNRLVEHRDALGHATTTSYDDHFQNSHHQTVLQKIDTDPLGLQTVTTYDINGQEALLEKKSSDQTLTQEENFYDAVGNLVFNIKNRQSITEWRYGPMHRLNALIEGSTKVTEFAYTETGQLKTQKKPDQTILTSSYDLLDQRIGYASSDGSVHYRYAYNKIGQLIGVVDQIHHTTSERQYDPKGRLLGEKLANGLALTFGYDDRGRKQTVRLPDQSTISYAYDALYLRAITRRNHTHHFTAYDLSCNLQQQQLVGRLGTQNYFYDLKGHKVGSKTSFNQQSAVFDPAGNVTHLTSNKDKQDFKYDSLHQLKAERNHTYSYDAHGNRTSKDGETFQYNPLHQVVSHLAYDPNGNPSQDQDTVYSYDALDRLISAQTPNHHTQFYYDERGRLLKQTAQGNEVLFIYDENKEIGTADASGRLVQLRILNPITVSERGAAVLLEIQGHEYYPQHDLFGNVKALFDLQGNLLESYEYSAFGEGVASNLNPWQYASKRTFSDLNLIHFGQRFYDPKYGRWLTTDPAGFADGNTHLYLFVENNPFSKFDHYGLNFMDFNQHYLQKEDPEQPSELANHKPYETTRAAANDAPHAIVEGAGNTAISMGNFFTDVGFGISLPYYAVKHNFEWSGIVSEWESHQNNFGYVRNQWNQGMQAYYPISERGALYNHISSGTERAIEAYLIVQSIGGTIIKGIDAFANEVGFSRFFAKSVPKTAEIPKKIPSRNRLLPDPKATGAHTVYRRSSSTGQITHYDTFIPQTNQFDPKPWQSTKRFDGLGKSHRNIKLGIDIPTPHVHDPFCPGGIRPALPWEIPE